MPCCLHVAPHLPCEHRAPGSQSSPPQSACSIRWAPTLAQVPSRGVRAAGHLLGIPQLGAVPGGPQLSSSDCHWPRGSVQGCVPDADPLRTPAHSRGDVKGDATTSEISLPAGHTLLSQTGPSSSPLWARRCPSHGHHHWAMTSAQASPRH